MSFLDRAFKKGLGKAVEEHISKAVGHTLNQNLPSQPQHPSHHFCTGCGAAIQPGMRFCANCGAPVLGHPATAQVQSGNTLPYFASILAQNFAQYEIHRDVSPADLGTLAPGAACRNLDFCLYQNGRLCGAVMLTPHNRDNNLAFRNAKQACQAAGVPFINFYSHLPNEREYVVTRIRSMLLG